MFKSYEAWAIELSETLVIETFKLIDGNTRSVGGGADRYVSTKFLERFIGALMFKTLTEEKKLKGLSQRDYEDYLIKNTGEMKASIQEAVASGFQHAMSAYSGKNLDYYCQIKLIPAPVSNKLN